MNWVNGIGAPAAVTVVDIAMDAYRPTWTEWADYIMVGLGYGLNLIKKGNGFTDNVGVAAFPLAGKKLYNRIRAVGVVSQVRQPVQRIARSYEPEFKTVGVV